MTTVVPERLRREIAGDLRPVRPLPPVWRRSVAVFIVALAVFAAVLTTHALRADLVSLSPWVGWGGAFLEALVGLLAIALALRESVPGAALSRGAIGLAIGLGLAMNLLVVIATRLSVGSGTPVGIPCASGMMCSRNETIIALPAFLLTVYLVLRALPLRPQIVGLLGGLGAGLVGDGINHLLCPMSSLRHVLVWHTGAMIGLMFIGWCCGGIWNIARQRRHQRSQA